nr:MOB kinase activator-like 1A [Tanacetum cinerariifolium]
KMSSRSSKSLYVGNLLGDIRESEVDDLFYKVVTDKQLAAAMMLLIAQWIEENVFGVSIGGGMNQKALFGFGDSNMSILIGQKSIVVSDPKYMDYLTEWIEIQLDNESIFPRKFGKIRNGKLISSEPSRPPVTFMDVNGADCCSIAKLQMADKGTKRKKQRESGNEKRGKKV